MKSPEGTVTAVPSAAVMIQVTMDIGRAIKMPASNTKKVAVSYKPITPVSDVG